MAMEYKRNLVPFCVCFLVAVALYILGTVLPYWQYVDVNFYQGAFRECSEGCRYRPQLTGGTLHEYEEYKIKIFIWTAVSGILLSLTAGILIALWLFKTETSLGNAGQACGLIAGLCGIVSVTLFAAYVNEVPNGFAFHIAVVGAVWLSLQSGIGLWIGSYELQWDNQRNTEDSAFVVFQCDNPGVQPHLQDD